VLPVYLYRVHIYLFIVRNFPLVTYPSRHSRVFFFCRFQQMHHLESWWPWSCPRSPCSLPDWNHTTPPAICIGKVLRRPFAIFVKSKTDELPFESFHPFPVNQSILVVCNGSTHTGHLGSISTTTVVATPDPTVGHFDCVQKT